MLLTLLKGILIGMIVSAPLGPVGVLCLRETLHGGRREGMLTGIGAMVSDVLYGFIVYLGVGLVLDFVMQYDALLRLIGGVIILVFAVWVYRNSHNPVKTAPTQRLSKRHGARKIVTAFFVTISNPFIMLLMLPLYTRFHFVQSDGFGLTFLIAMLGLGSGCMLWWYILTYLVNLIATRTGHGGVRIISQGTAIVLGVIGVIGIYTGIESICLGEGGGNTNRLEQLKNNHQHISVKG